MWTCVKSSSIKVQPPENQVLILPANQHFNVRYGNESTETMLRLRTDLLENLFFLLGTFGSFKFGTILISHEQSMHGRRTLLTKSALLSSSAKAWYALSTWSPRILSGNPKRVRICVEWPVSSSGKPREPTVSKTPMHLQYSNRCEYQAVTLLQRRKLTNFTENLFGPESARILPGESWHVQGDNFCLRVCFSGNSKLSRLDIWKQSNVPSGSVHFPSFW